MSFCSSEPTVDLADCGGLLVTIIIWTRGVLAIAGDQRGLVIIFNSSAVETFNIITRLAPYTRFN